MVGRCLGQGGFGTVFSALRLSDMKNAAVKVMQKTTIKEWRKVSSFVSVQELFYSIANIEISNFIYCHFRSKVARFRLKFIFFCL